MKWDGCIHSLVSLDYTIFTSYQSGHGMGFLFLVSRLSVLNRPLGFGRTHGNTPLFVLNYSLERVINGVVVVCDVVVMFDLLLVVLWWRYSLIVHTGFLRTFDRDRIYPGVTTLLPLSFEGVRAQTAASSFVGGCSMTVLIISLWWSRWTCG